MAQKMGSTSVNIEALMGATEARHTKGIQLPSAMQHLVGYFLRAGQQQNELYGGINLALVRNAFYASLEGKPKDDEHPTKGPHPTDIAVLAGGGDKDDNEHPLDGPHPTDIRLNYR